MFKETVDVYCENRMEHTNTLCGQNAENLFIKTGDTFSNQWTLKG
jgi:translation initiation factor IF-1